jgi:hypothetical protein
MKQKLRIPDKDAEKIIELTDSIRQKKNAYMREYQSREQNKVKVRNYNTKNRSKINENKKEYRRKNPLAEIYCGAKSRAKRAGIEFTIELKDIFMPTHCPVLGIKLEVNDQPFSPSSISLDKVNPRVGYVKGNVRVISWRANDLKRNGTIQEFECIVAYMKKELER